MDQQRERNNSFYCQKYTLFAISLIQFIGSLILLVIMSIELFEMVYGNNAGDHFKQVSYLV